MATDFLEASVTGTIVNADELARIFDCSRSTVKNWRQQGMPYLTAGARGKPGQYDTAACINWLIARRLGDDKPLDLNVERARLAHHQADKTALEARALKGELVRTLDALELWQATIAAARAKFLSLPRKMAAQVIHAETPAEVEEALQQAITEALAELGRSGLPRATERALESSGASLDTPAAAHRQ